MVREYTHDTPTEVVWELQISAAPEAESRVGWTIFSSERIPHF